MNPNRPPMYHSATSGSKANWNTSYQSIPSGPNMGYYNYPTSQPFDARHLPSRKTAQTVRVAVITLILALALIIPCIVWAWYVLIHERTVIDRPTLTVFTTAGPTQFLLLSTVSTTVTKILLGPIMALYAFTASADWLASTEHGLQHRLPSPVHLGSLLSLFQGASLMSLYNAFRGAANRKQLAWPPVLKKTVALLVWLLFLAYSLTTISLWLQIDAKPTASVPGSTDFGRLGYDSQNTLFARTVNQTYCDGRGRGDELASCGLTYISPGGSASIGSRVAALRTNNSETSRAAWLNDNIAVLAPATVPSIGYRAKALGVRAACRSVTDQCVKCNSTSPNTRLRCDRVTPTDDPTFKCIPSAILNVTYANTLWAPSGPISKGNGSVIRRGFDTNPIPYGKVVTSAAYVNLSLYGGDYFAGNTGFFVYERSGGVNALYCDVSVYDVVYEFTPPETYTSLSWALSDTKTAAYVGYGMAYYGDARVELIDGAGLRGNESYQEIFARQLSKGAVMSVGTIVSATSSEQLLPGRQAGTRVTLVGMVLLVITIACIILTIIAIGFHATIVNLKTNSKFLAAARGRLISVYPLIGDSFGGLNFDYQNHQSAVSAGMDETAFSQESEMDRLHLVQDKVDGGPVRGSTVRLRPRRI